LDEPEKASKYDAGSDPPLSLAALWPKGDGDFFEL
jgi:hypothetical protein